MSLFPELDAAVEAHEAAREAERERAADLSPDQRRTLRQADDVAAGRHPLTRGPLHPLASRHRDATSPKSDPFTCGSCWFREVIRYHNNSFAKCLGGETSDGNFPRVTHSAASDVRAWWPACPDYSPSDRISTDAARHIPQHEATDTEENESA